MAKKEKRFWVGDPDLAEDDEIGGFLLPDDDGNVYLNRREGSRPEPTPPRRVDGKAKKRKPRR